TRLSDAPVDLAYAPVAESSRQPARWMRDLTRSWPIRLLPATARTSCPCRGTIPRTGTGRREPPPVLPPPDRACPGRGGSAPPAHDKESPRRMMLEEELCFADSLERVVLLPELRQRPGSPGKIGGQREEDVSGSEHRARVLEQ